MAVRGNDIKRRRNFSESIFREWLPADSVWLGMTEAQCGMEPSQCMLPGSGTSESQSDIFRLNREDNAGKNFSFVSVNENMRKYR